MKAKIAIILLSFLVLIACKSNTDNENDGELVIDNVIGTYIILCNDTINIPTLINNELIVFKLMDHGVWEYNLIVLDIEVSMTDSRPYGVNCNNSNLMSAYYITNDSQQLFFLTDIYSNNESNLLLSSDSLYGDDVVMKADDNGINYVVVLDHVKDDNKKEITTLILFEIKDDGINEMVLQKWEESLYNLEGMSIDSDNVIHIMVEGIGPSSDLDNELYHIYGKDDNWQLEKLGSHHISIAFDIDGENNIHLFYDYYDENEETNILKYEIKSGDTWQEQTLTENERKLFNFYFFLKGDLIARNDGIIHILGYRYEGDDPSDEHGIIYYLTNKSGSWERTTVEEDYEGVGEYSFDVDENNNVHISYFRNTDKKLIYATNQSGQWEYYPVEP